MMSLGTSSSAMKSSGVITSAKSTESTSTAYSRSTVPSANGTRNFVASQRTVVSTSADSEGNVSSRYASRKVETRGNENTVKTCSPKNDFDDESRIAPQINRWLVYSTYIAKMIVMTIVLTTSDQYTQFVGLNGSVWSGLLVGVVPAAAGLSVFAWQFICKYIGIKQTLVLQAVVGTIGGIMYSLAGLADSPSLLMIGRVLAGSAGAVNIVLEYIAITCGKKQKNEVLGKALTFVNVGLAIGPLLSSIIYLVFNDVLHMYAEPSRLVLNTLTIPGWCGALIYAVTALAFTFWWIPLPNGERSRYLRHKKSPQLGNGDDDKVQTMNHPGFLQGFVIACLLVSVYCVGVGISSIETRTSFVAQYGWSFGAVNAGFYLAGAFLWIAFIGFVGHSDTVRRKLKPTNWTAFEDRRFVFVAYTCATFGLLLFYEYNKHLGVSARVTLWTIGLTIFGGALVLGRAVLFAMTLKVCPPMWTPLVASLLGLINSVGRGTGPVIATFVGQGFMEPTLYSTILLVVFAANTITIAIMYPKLST